MSESEMSSMQDCYNGLTGLRTRLRFTAEERIELLRKELHVYGFLEPEPDLTGLAGLLQRAIDDPVHPHLPPNTHTPTTQTSPSTPITHPMPCRNMTRPIRSDPSSIDILNQYPHSRVLTSRSLPNLT